MRIVIQRVTHADVTVDGNTTGTIDRGMMILVGVATGDTDDDARYLARKTLALRIFDDDNGVMNRSVVDTGGNILAISQFTLLAATRKGNRPSYIHAAQPDEARRLYDYYCHLLGEGLGHPVERGVFGADMKVSLTNDGPVTIVMDTRE